jgi:hypothetical protein
MVGKRESLLHSLENGFASGTILQLMSIIAGSYFGPAYSGAGIAKQKAPGLGRALYLPLQL